MADTNIGGDHWAWFGDGNMAQIVTSKDYIKKSTTGKKYTKFIFIPSQRIIQMYNVQPDINDMDVKEYHWTQVIWLERGVARSRCIVETDYDGGDTPSSRRNAELKDTVEDFEQLVRSAQAGKNRAYQELDIERQQKHQAIKLQTNIMKELENAKSRGGYGEESDEGYQTDSGE